MNCITSATIIVRYRCLNSEAHALQCLPLCGENMFVALVGAEKSATITSMRGIPWIIVRQIHHAAWKIVVSLVVFPGAYYLHFVLDSRQVSINVSLEEQKESI